MKKYCILFFPKIIPKALESILGKRISTMLYKANINRLFPRDRSYMKELAINKFGNNIEFIDFENLNIPILKNQDDIVLLWNDSIGRGWYKIEKIIFKLNKRVTVLNGRRRLFKLPKSKYSKTYINILFLRFLEKFWIGEIIFAIGIILFTPYLIFKDIFRKR